MYLILLKRQRRRILSTCMSEQGTLQMTHLLQWPIIVHSNVNKNDISMYFFQMDKTELGKRNLQYLDKLPWYIYSTSFKPLEFTKNNICFVAILIFIHQVVYIPKPSTTSAVQWWHSMQINVTQISRAGRRIDITIISNLPPKLQ